MPLRPIHSAFFVPIAFIILNTSSRTLQLVDFFGVPSYTPLVCILRTLLICVFLVDPTDTSTHVACHIISFLDFLSFGHCCHCKPYLDAQILFSLFFFFFFIPTYRKMSANRIRPLFSEPCQVVKFLLSSLCHRSRIRRFQVPNLVLQFHKVPCRRPLHSLSRLSTRRSTYPSTDCLKPLPLDIACRGLVTSIHIAHDSLE